MNEIRYCQICETVLLFLRSAGIPRDVEKVGTLNWRRTRRSKFKAGLWDVTLCDLSLPDQLKVFCSAAGMPCLPNKVGFVWTRSLCWDGAKVYVGNDALSLCDQHHKPPSITPGFTAPHHQLHSGITRRKRFIYTWSITLNVHVDDCIVRGRLHFTEARVGGGVQYVREDISAVLPEKRQPAMDRPSKGKWGVADLRGGCRGPGPVLCGHGWMRARPDLVGTHMAAGDALRLGRVRRG